MPFQVDHRIAHQLPGTVERDVTTTFHLEQLDAVRGEILGRRDEVAALGRPTERHDWWVLHQQQYVFRDLARDPPPRDVPLQLQGGCVRQRAQIDDVKLAHHITITPSGVKHLP